MTTFHDIPTHIIGQIFSYIGDISTLLSLVKTSLLCRRVAEPYLYETYRNRRKSSGEGSLDHTNLVSFTRTVLQNRRLALKVKHFDLGRWSTHYDADLFEPNLPYNPSDLQLFLSAGSHLELTDDLDTSENIEDSWTSALRSSIPDALVRLLLTYLPALETATLTMGPSPIPPWSFIRRMARQPRSFPNGSLSSLHTLRISHDPSSPLGVSLGRFSGFFLLPSLRTITGSGWLEEDDPIHNWTSPPSSSPVTHLHLSDCSLNEVSIRLLLDVFLRLESFRYTASSAGTQQFTPRALKRAIQQHRGTLRELRLQMYSEHWEDFTISASSYLLDLSRFSVLQHVEIEEFALLGHGEWYEDESEMPRLSEVLPRGLRHLKITECGERVKEGLIDLATVCNERFSRLRRVDVVFWRGAMDQDMEGLRRVFAVLGVRFRSRVGR